MISRNTNKLTIRLLPLESLSSDISPVALSSKRIINLGTDIPTIKHHVVVKAVVVNIVITSPWWIKNVLLKK